jgi:predicted hydrocarbon binding protein
VNLHEGAKKMAKARRLGGWMTRFKRCIDAEAGAAVSRKVIIKTEQFDGTSNYAQKAEWIRKAVQRLEKEAGKATAMKVMQACGMKCCGPTQQKRAKQFMEESKSVKELLAKLNEAGIGGGRLKLKNKNTIVGGYDRCYCGRVKHTQQPFPTDTYCHCSAGWYKSLFEAAFDKPVKVKLKQSIIQGADSCEFEIEFR